MRDIQVDVRGFVPGLRQEALEQQIESYRVYCRDSEAIADGGIRRGTATLHEDSLPPREPHDVPHDEEIVGEAETLDHGQLVLDLPVFRLAGGIPVPFSRALLHQPSQKLVRVPSSRYGKGREPGPDIGNPEAAPISNLRGARHGAAALAGTGKGRGRGPGASQEHSTGGAVLLERTFFA